MKLTFREMVPEDAEAVEQVEKACFAMPWSRESFWREAANEHTLYLLAIDEEAPEQEQVIGYVGCWILCGEGQITNVAVAPAYRGKQVGTAMIAKLIELVKEREVTAMTLEVRPSNAPALALYHKFGFKESGRRPGYYRDNGEDAIIMWNTKI